MRWAWCSARARTVEITPQPAPEIDVALWDTVRSLPKREREADRVALRRRPDRAGDRGPTLGIAWATVARGGPHDARTPAQDARGRGGLGMIDLEKRARRARGPRALAAGRRDRQPPRPTAAIVAAWHLGAHRGACWSSRLGNRRHDRPSGRPTDEEAGDPPASDHRPGVRVTLLDGLQPRISGPECSGLT